jgi:hypothetical protein
MAKIQTDKQRKLVKLLSENVGLPKPKTMLEMMLEAGYEESTARQQSGILAGIREELDPIVAGNEFNFFVKEAENLRWEEVKTDLGIEQKPTWGKQPNHAIDTLSYLLAKVHKPISTAPMPAPTIGLVKPFPGMPGVSPQ